VLLGENTKGVVDSKLKSRERACFESAEALFELCPAFLDRVEVWRVRRQIEQGCSGLADEIFHARDLVRSEVIQNHNLAGLELRAENLLQVSEKDIAIGGSFDHPSANPTGSTDGTQNSQRAPVACRNSFVHTLAAQRAPITPGHFCCYTAFVDENEALRIDLFAFFLPELSLRGDSLTLLFSGVERFFLKRHPRPFKMFHTCVIPI
jgi:hypothetical protein